MKMKRLVRKECNLMRKTCILPLMLEPYYVVLPCVYLISVLLDNTCQDLNNDKTSLNDLVYKFISLIAVIKCHST